VIAAILTGAAGLLFYPVLSKKSREFIETRQTGPTVALQKQATPPPGLKPEASPDLDTAKRRVEELEKAIAVMRNKQEISEKR